MDRHVAAEVVARLLAATQLLADAATVYRRCVGPDGARLFTEASGETVLAVYQLLYPILAEHPDLDDPARLPLIRIDNERSPIR